jgi:phosphoribosyl 1,2-cyclic phosphodiesterase
MAGMTINFWGVRGSVPSPGSSTVRYGGNTSCVSLDFGDKILVLDAGTGIRRLGKSLRERPSVLCALIDQMDGVHFPVTADNLPAGVKCIANDEVSYLRGEGFDISRVNTNHPGGGHGYRINHGGKSFVYLTDNELAPPYPKENEIEQFATFCEGADALVHDAQYRVDDMPKKLGWGHSTFEQACDLAKLAKVKQLVMFHHDPDRTDDELDAMGEHAKTLLGDGPACVVADEELVLKL